MQLAALCERVEVVLQAVEVTQAGKQSDTAGIVIFSFEVISDS